MCFMSNVSVFCFLASYVVAFALELTRLLRRSSIRWYAIVAVSLAGFIAHTVYLFVQSGQKELPPLLSSMQDWVLVLAWIAILFYLFASLIDREFALGVFLLPLVLLLIVSAYFVSADTNFLVSTDNPEQAALKRLAITHAGLLVFGIAGVLVGFAMSLMYLYQHRRLKHKQSLREGFSLPSLARLAKWNWWAVMVSVFLLTLGMASGIGLGFQSSGSPSPVTWTDPVVLASGLTWVAMIVFVVWLVKSRHPAGRKVAMLTIWAFGFLLVTLVGTLMFAERIGAGHV